MQKQYVFFSDKMGIKMPRDFLISGPVADGDCQLDGVALDDHVILGT